MDLLRCVLGLIPCDRLLPRTAPELVMFATVVALRLLVLATLAEAVLLQVAAMARWRARRPAALSKPARDRVPGGRDVTARNTGVEVPAVILFGWAALYGAGVGAAWAGGGLVCCRRAGGRGRDREGGLSRSVGRPVCGCRAGCGGRASCLGCVRDGRRGHRPSSDAQRPRSQSDGRRCGRCRGVRWRRGVDVAGTVVPGSGDSAAGGRGSTRTAGLERDRVADFPLRLVVRDGRGGCAFVTAGTPV